MAERIPFPEIDKDGCLTEKDLASFANFISDCTSATEAERAKTREERVKWFAILRPDSSTDTITENQLMESQSDLFLNNNANLRRPSVATFSALFDNLDLVKDGLISLEELTIYYGGHEVKDEEFVQRVFQKLDSNGDGYISRDELVKAGVDYWSNAEDTK